MAKRIKVGERYRRGFKLKVAGEWKWFAPGSILPEEFNTKIPGRFFRDKRAIWVEDAPVKKVRPVPAPASLPPPAPAPVPAPAEVPAEEPKPIEAEALVAEAASDVEVAPKKKRRRTKKTVSKSGGLSE